MPDGSRLTFQQLSQMMQGKNPKEAFGACGYDFDEVARIVNS
jgi:hypothetical protein